MTYEEYKENKNDIHWDIAWQIFDQVNQRNDVDKHIDLNCLEIEDAVAIVKQKIYDLAILAQKQFKKNVAKPQHYILNVLCDEIHTVPD